MPRVILLLAFGGVATLLQYVLLVIGVQLDAAPASVVAGAAFVISAMFTSSPLADSPSNQRCLWDRPRSASW